MPPRLIVHADDFGLTPGINRGIGELYQAGVLKSASLMANGAAFDDAVRVATDNPGLGVGCHLVFVDGMPVAHPESIPTLLGADGKHFRPSALDFAQAALRGAISQADLMVEAQAQIQKLQRAGLDVTHLDTHKHTHIFPSVLRALLHIGERCGVLPLRMPFEPRWSAERSLAPWLRRLQLRATERWCVSFKEQASNRDYQELLPAGTLGMAATGTLSIPVLRDTLLAMLRNGGDQTWELCCHAGHVDDALRLKNTRLITSRAAEYLALLEVLPEIMRTAESLELIHYGNLGIAGLQRASGHFAPYNGFEKVL